MNHLSFNELLSNDKLSINSVSNISFNNLNTPFTYFEEKITVRGLDFQV